MTAAMGGPIGVGTQYYTSTLPRERALASTTSLTGLASASALAAANGANGDQKSAPFSERVITAEVPEKIDDAGLFARFSAYFDLLKLGKSAFDPKIMIAILEKLKQTLTKLSYSTNPEIRARSAANLAVLEPLMAQIALLNNAANDVPLSQQGVRANPMAKIQSPPPDVLSAGTDKESMTSKPSVNETSVFSLATAWMSAQIEGMSDRKKMIIKVAAVYLIVAYGSSFFTNNNSESLPQP